jgi:type I restriction enzyme S subunit
MMDVPQGWTLATVGDIADLADGPFGSNLKTAHYTEVGPRVVRLQNIGDGVFRDERAHIAREHYERLMKHAVYPGEIVAASLGEDAPRACLIPAWLGPAVVKADCIRIRAFEGVESAFLMWMLNSPPARAQAASLIKGVGRPRLGLGGLKRLVVPVPPLAEQQHIVAVIEAQLSRLDAAEQCVGRALRGLGQLRSSRLRTIFDRAWDRHALSDLCDPERPICYGILKPRTTGNLTVPYIEVRAIRGGRIDVKSLHRTTQALHDEFRRSELRRGDVVLAIRGSFDRAAIVPDELDGANISRDVARIAPTEVVDPRFLAYYLGSPLALEHYASMARGVGVRGINIGDLRKMRVPVPPILEQRTIVEELDRQMSVIASLTAAAERALRRASATRRALLQDGFTGRLVGHEADDEPVSALVAQAEWERGSTARSASRRRQRAPA